MGECVSGWATERMRDSPSWPVTRPSAQSPNHSPIHPFTHLFAHSPIRPFAHCGYLFLNGHADRVAPLRPGAVVVLDVLEPEQVLQREPRVAAALADAAVGD